MVPGTQNVARAERSRARPSLGGGRDGSVPGLLLKFHGRLSWDLEVELLRYPRGGYSEAPHVRHLVGYWSEGVNGATWCNSLLGRLLRGRSDTPQSGIGAQRYPFICSCLIINFVRIRLALVLMG